MIQFQLAKYYRQNFRSINMSQKIIKIIRTHVDKLWLAKASHMIFLRKLFQSTRLYIEEIVRRLASKCAWQIMRFWYQSYERMLMELGLSIGNMYFKVEREDIVLKHCHYCFMFWVSSVWLYSIVLLHLHLIFLLSKN